MIRLFALLLLPALLPAQQLTPAPGDSPQIHGPRVYGVRPGHPFLYRIPCTGQRPIRFSVKGLPAGLTLDPLTGIVTGSAPRQRGEYLLTLRAKNLHGQDDRRLKIIVGDTLALTPPMGWNHWYTYYDRVSDKLFRSAADALIASGMADFGYQYVNIDDCWMTKPGSSIPELSGPARDAGGGILANANFPNPKALTDYIHQRGLKAGIYTSPGPLTCAKYEGAYGHEEADALRFAEWGFDFLKYDWCSYGKLAPQPTLADRQRPYAKMGSILRGLDRDVVFNLCQYGAGEVWKWGADVGGQCWRTTGDLGLVKNSQLPGFYQIGLSNAAHWQYAGPGRWNDPDYILLGFIGNAHNQSEPAKRTTLTPDEQYSYMSMWSLMAAPLFYSGDLSRLDAFTRNVLCNAEVIDVDQDPLGKQARIVRQSDTELVLAKPMEDGSLAVGLFNLSAPREMSVDWAELGLTGSYRVRDVWRQKYLRTLGKRYKTPVATHGVAFVLLSPKAS